MSGKTYNLLINGLLFAFLLCNPLSTGIISVSNHFISWLTLGRFLNIFINIISVFFAAAIFFVGVYFSSAHFKSVKIKVKPFWVICLGAIFLMYTFLPLIFLYSTLNNIKSGNENISYEFNNKLKEFAENSDCDELKNWEVMAMMHFENSGEAISYLNRKGEFKKFSPSENDIKKRKIKIEHDKELITNIFLCKTILYYKVFVFVLCFLLWCTFLKLYPPKSIVVTS